MWQDAPGSWAVSGGMGPTRYAGDLSEDLSLSLLRPGWSVSGGGSYRISNRLTARADARLYYIYGKHEGGRVYYNNLSFYALNPDVWAGLQADLWPITANRGVIPYVFAGLGMTYLTPKASYRGQSVSLAPLRTEGIIYNRLPGIFTYGVGVPMRLNIRSWLKLEMSYTHVLNDYLDDVSTRYPDFSQLTALGAAVSDRRPELGLPPNRPGDQRGNPPARDGYFIASVRLAYMLSTPARRQYGQSRQSPRFRRGR
ncbi:MAG: hypothetical protein H7Z72_01020 [Bacteroidetes bacterium]|nr:hypothetical protein [Fibrella sp.]